MSSDDETKKEEILFDLVKRRYDSEWDRIRDLDDKAGNLIGYVTIVTGLLIGLGTFDILDKLSKPEYYVPYFGGIFLLILSVVFSLLALKVSKWSASPDIDTIQSMLKDSEYEYTTILRQGIIRIGEVVLEIEKKNDRKANIIGLSWYCLIAGLIGTFVYVIIFTR
jgi:hypothetical protein